MRILFVSNLYPPNVVGGYERLCFSVASAFAARGHAVSVLTSGHGGGRADFPGQSIRQDLTLLAGASIYLPYEGDAASRDAINRGNVAALRRTIDALSPELVFAWNLFFLDRSFLDALGTCGVPVAVMLTDNWLANMIRPELVAGFFRDHVFGSEPFPRPPPPAPALPPRGIARRLLDRLRPPPAPAAPAPTPAALPPVRFPMIAIYGSRFMRDFYREAGLAFEVDRVVHNGVHQEIASDAVFADRSATVAPGTLRLLFAGRLVDLKGADTAVAALAHLPPDIAGMEVRLTLLGDDQDAAYVASLREAIAASGASARITMAPTVAPDALFDLFQRHDVYLFPSLYEPFSLTLIHALACGIPTIASDAGGNPEIVVDGVSGLVVPKADAAALARAITRLAGDGALRARLAEGGWESARGFTFERMIAGMEDALAGSDA